MAVLAEWDSGAIAAVAAVTATPSGLSASAPTPGSPTSPTKTDPIHNLPNSGECALEGPRGR
ncbi:unannotated protein [freshwater metagenome]|uniref:Unannotated protein n=1 Tax=freshwater metagenome TaxID=449393 RepID=A0A6J7KV14_9ZZZZ